MANPDLTQDPPPSISAAELRRRLMASTPPPVSASMGSLDLDSLAGAQNGPRSSLGRLTMPGQHGPVAANSLPPVETGSIPDLPNYGRSRLDPTGLLQSGHSNSQFGIPGLPSEPDVAVAATSRSSSTSEPTPENYKKIKQENRELRKLLEEMKTLLQEASDNEQKHSVKEQEIAVLLQAKQREFDELSAQMQMIEEQVSSGALAPAPAVPRTRDELEEWSDELEKEASKITQERKKLEGERQQLREDEEALENQMRQMEVSMARDRALMARQETELKRLSAEIQHELEIMQRGDAALREQLSKFQRRAADVLQGKVGGPPAGGGRR